MKQQKQIEHRSLTGNIYYLHSFINPSKKKIFQEKSQRIDALKQKTDKFNGIVFPNLKQTIDLSYNSPRSSAKQFETKKQILTERYDEYSPNQNMLFDQQLQIEQLSQIIKNKNLQITSLKKSELFKEENEPTILDKYQPQITTLLADMTRGSEAIQTRNEKLKQLTQNLEELPSVDTEDIYEYLVNIKNLIMDLLNTLSQTSENEISINNLKYQVEELKVQNSKLEMQNKKYKEKSKQLNSELQENQRELKFLQEENQLLQKKIQTEKQLNIENEKKMQGFENRIEVLQQNQEVTSSSHNNPKLKSSLGKTILFLYCSKGEIIKENETWKRLIQELKQELQKKETLVSKLSSVNQNLTKKIETFRMKRVQKIPFYDDELSSQCNIFPLFTTQTLPTSLNFQISTLKQQDIAILNDISLKGGSGFYQHLTKAKSSETKLEILNLVASQYQMLREFSEGVNMLQLELINGRGGDFALFDNTSVEEVMKNVAKAGPVLFGCEEVQL